MLPLHYIDLLLTRFQVKDTKDLVKLDGCDINILNWNAGLPHTVTLGQVLQLCIPANRPEIRELLITHDTLLFANRQTNRYQSTSRSNVGGC